MKILSNYSNRELNIWSELILNFVVCFYFFNGVFQLVPGSDEYVADLAGIIIGVVLIAVVYSIVVFGLINIITKAEAKDEMDRIIDVRSYKMGYIAMDIFVTLIMGHIILNESMGNIVSIGISEMTPILIAQLLLMTLVASSTVKSLSRLYYYKKGI
jgi:hypothetical protein|tara:strand:- start:316 stop:786 length:471 start_codon:yes stop_codon:yes gene_type:complete